MRNPFPLLIIGLFILAGMGELLACRWWKAMFYFSSAFLNVCVINI